MAKKSSLKISGGPASRFIQHHCRHFSAASPVDAALVAPLIFARVLGW